MSILNKPINISFNTFKNIFPDHMNLKNIWVSFHILESFRIDILKHRKAF